MSCIEMTYLEYVSASFDQIDEQLTIGDTKIEDESIVGNADKITFYLKDYESILFDNLQNRLNPYLISKIDLHSV